MASIFILWSFFATRKKLSQNVWASKGARDLAIRGEEWEKVVSINSNFSVDTRREYENKIKNYDIFFSRHMNIYGLYEMQVGRSVSHFELNEKPRFIAFSIHEILNEKLTSCSTSMCVCVLCMPEKSGINWIWSSNMFFFSFPFCVSCERAYIMMSKHECKRLHPGLYSICLMSMVFSFIRLSTVKAAERRPKNNNLLESRIMECQVVSKGRTCNKFLASNRSNM